MKTVLAVLTALTKKTNITVTALLVILLAFSVNAFTHELQPSLLEIRQLTNDQFDISWKAPTYFKKDHPAELQLPETWQTIGTPTVKNLSDSKLHKRIVKVPQGNITGSTIRFINLESTITDVFVHVYRLDNTKTSAIARPNHPWVDIQGPKTSWQVFIDYLVLGVDHILSGFDHLLFVLALLLIVVGWRKLLVTITSFTVAHSITLAAITLGFVWVPGPPVEAVIALSILFLASEMIKINQGKFSLTAKFPWVIAFVFGLLHGFGFAGALSDIGIQDNEIIFSLLSFNMGVELGQLLFVLAALTAITILRKVPISWPKWSIQIPAYTIGGISAFWLIQRVGLF